MLPTRVANKGFRSAGRLQKAKTPAGMLALPGTKREIIHCLLYTTSYSLSSKKTSKYLGPVSVSRNMRCTGRLKGSLHFCARLTSVRASANLESALHDGWSARRNNQGEDGLMDFAHASD